MKNVLLIVVGIVVLIGVGVWYINANKGAENTSQDTSTPTTEAVTLSLANRTLTPNTATVTQGNTITIRVVSDEAGEFHISGYEIENDMEANTELSFSFVADKAGRYNFELHPKAAEGAEDHTEDSEDAVAGEDHAEAEEDIVVGAFVVNPR